MRRLLDQRLEIAYPGPQLLHLDELVFGVGQGGVAGAEADGGDAGGVGVAAVSGEDAAVTSAQIEPRCQNYLRHRFGPGGGCAVHREPS